ncbi:MAG: ABC transporter ATP-binding protein [Salinisphaera sp.]|nr:ABC transporter ATP-binding protein [Salinisphaera sp.]
MSEALLELEDVVSGYDELQVLWGVSVAVMPKRLTTLVGANGAGKTTLLRAALGSIRVWSGRVRFEGEDVTRLSAYQKAARGLVLVPEGRQLFNDMTVEENLELGAYTARARPDYAANLERVFTYFPRLKERRKQKAGTFSGGEQQMLAVARGLMASPKVLIIDELSLGLSPLLTQQLFGTLADLKNDGLTLVLVEQNLHLALALSDYAYVLAEGRLHSEGPSREVANDPDVRKAYMGM